MIRIVEKGLKEDNKDVFLWTLDNNERRVKDIYCIPFSSGSLYCTTFRLESGKIFYDRDFFIIRDQGKNWINIHSKDIISMQAKGKHVEIFLQKGVLSFDLL